MLRAILRNIQNALVFSSVLLVVLAMQRLQHYEFPHSAMEGDYNSQHGQDYAIDSIVKVGYNHQVILGREFHIGLFRFFLPRLEHTDTNTKAVGGWQAKSRIAFIVDIYHDLCDQDHWLDAALLLQYTLRTRKHLYAILHQPDNNSHESCNATTALQNAGYKIIRASNVTQHNNHENCLDQSPWQIYSTQIKKVDRVFHVPLVSLATKTSGSSSSSSRTGAASSSSSVASISSNTRANRLRRRHRHLGMLTSESLHPRIHSLVPGTFNCTAGETPSACKVSPCPVSQTTSLISLPMNCPFLYPCSKVAAQNVSSVCFDFHKQWYSARAEWEEQHNRVPQTPAEYCRDGIYSSMHRSKQKDGSNDESEDKSADGEDTDNGSSGV